MLYILNWSIKTENRHKALDRFVSADLSQEQPDGFRIKGRYHSMGDFTGVVVFEADNEAAIFQWLLNWNDLVDVEYKPVVEDEEAVGIGKAFLGK